MTVQDVACHRSEDLVTVVLDRPTRRNAITFEMWRAITDLFIGLEQDPTVRGVILTGAGGAFSAGADIADFEQTRASLEQGLAYEAAVDAACDAIAALGRPVIAAIDGFCVGGACNLAMACDFRFVSPTASMAIPAARLSIVYGVRGSARLLALVGLAEAKRIFFGAGRFDAERALTIGFADRIDADPTAAARRYLQDLADLAPLSIAGAKHILNALSHPDQPFEAAAAHAVIVRALTSRDYVEGRAAFAAKRLPRFEGL
jgi:enoyl-CoA hydratase/carnithine racemase